VIHIAAELYADDVRRAVACPPLLYRRRMFQEVV